MSMLLQNNHQDKMLISSLRDVQQHGCVYYEKIQLQRPAAAIIITSVKALVEKTENRQNMTTNNVNKL